MKKWFCLVLTILFTACSYNGPTVAIVTDNGNFSFKVEIADEPDERQEGLMNRDSLESGKGMLFIFEKEKFLAFWMKNTYIPLDMIYIDEDFEIVHIVHSADPCVDGREDCPNYPSTVPARYVLEIGAGLAKEYGFKNGNFVEFYQVIESR